jgi:hypothetical protein
MHLTAENWQRAFGVTGQQQRGERFDDNGSFI